MLLRTTAPVMALAAMLLIVVPSFAQSDPLDARQGGGLPTLASSDGEAIAWAYGDLSVFILNVAAGNDGVPQQPDGEDAFNELFAQQFAASYAQLSLSDQQSYASLPATALQIRQVWPSLPLEQRLALRNQWAANVQPMVANAPCELFDGLVRAQLVPSFEQYKSTNIAHVQQCWREHPELTKDAQERAVATGSAGGTGDHATYIGMMNANTLNYTASMNIASMGTATYKTR
jgi:hypothetical protein